MCSKGHSLLEKMGWKGNGIGKMESGKINPVSDDFIVSDGSGIGFKNNKKSNNSFLISENPVKNYFRERFNQIQDNNNNNNK